MECAVYSNINRILILESNDSHPDFREPRDAIEFYPNRCGSLQTDSPTTCSDPIASVALNRPGSQARHRGRPVLTQSVLLPIPTHLFNSSTGFRPVRYT